ncbi:MAG TPA: glycogen-binding domain-containing protein [Gemmatimonadaceae bacterium]
MTPHYLTGCVRSGLLILAMGRPLAAQQRVVVDAAITAAHFPDDNATAVGPSVRLSAVAVTNRFTAAADGGAIAALGATSGFASLRGAVRAGGAMGWSSSMDAELSTVAGSSHSGAASTGLAGLRAMWNGATSGAWLRGVTHTSSRENTSLNGAGADAGAWYAWESGTISASATQEWTRAELYTGRFRTGFVGTVPVKYSEANLSLHLTDDLASLDATSTVRRDRDAPREIDAAYSATAAFWTSDRVALVLSAAHQLPDWIRGADAADVVSVGVRIRQWAPVRERAARVLPIVQLSDSASGTGLRVRAAGARTVDVMGDFTGWEAQPLVRNGDVFERAIRLASGSHRVLLRIDGGAWRAAVNTPLVDDDFGGKTGLLVVP